MAYELSEEESSTLLGIVPGDLRIKLRLTGEKGFIHMDVARS